MTLYKRVFALILAFLTWQGVATISAQVILSVEISDDTGANRMVHFGFDETATNGYDSGIDQLAPPPAPFGVFDVRFIGGPFHLYRDVRPFSENETVWTLQITPANGATTINLEWEFDHQYVSRGTVLQAGAQTIPMRENQSAALAPIAQTVQFTFEPPAQTVTELNGAEGFRLFSAPYRWMHIRDVTNGLWTQGFPNAITTAGDPNVFFWDEASSSFTAAEDGFAELTPGRGITVFVYEDDNFDGIPDGFPKSLMHLGYTRMDDVQVPLSWSGNAANQGWNLIGNPYELPLDLAELQAGIDYENMNPFYYMWIPEADENNGAYLIFDPTGPEIPEVTFNGIVEASKAFWVRASGVNPELTFSRDHLHTARNVANQPVMPVARFTIEANGFKGRTAIVFSEDGTRSNIPFLSPLRMNWLELATIDEHGFSTIRYAPAEFDEEQLIPITLMTNQSGWAELSFDIPAEILMLTEWTLCDSVDDNCYNLNGLNSVQIQLPEMLAIPFGYDDSKMPQQPILQSEEITARFELIIRPKHTTAEPRPELPQELELHQNYPNPFNPQTRIEYMLPDASEVVLEVFSLQGQRVATLVQTYQTAGSYSVSFDASQLPSGVYFYRLSAAGKTSVKKMTLLK